MTNGYLRQCTTEQAENGGQPKLGENVKMLGQDIRTTKILIYSSDRNIMACRRHSWNYLHVK